VLVRCEWQERHPEQDEQIEEKRSMRDLVDAGESAVMADPHHAHEEEGRGMDNQRGRDVAQRRQAMASRNFQVQHEQRQHNREDAVTEEFDAVLVHWRPPHDEAAATCRACQSRLGRWPADGRRGWKGDVDGPDNQHAERIGNHERFRCGLNLPAVLPSRPK